MTSEWRTIRAADFIDFNPRLSLKKGAIATKVAMDKLKPFSKKIPEAEKAEFNSGAKFCNGDTVMARITPCLENIEKTISGDWGKDTPSGNNTEMVYCIRGADIPEVRAGNKGKMPTRYILPKNYAAKQLVDGDIVVEISGGSPTQSTGRAAAV